MTSHPRRHFLKGTLQGLALASLGRITLANAADDFTPLRQLAADKDMSFGFAVDPARIGADEAYRNFVARQANLLVPENALKWAQVHPAPDRFNFGPVDELVAFARSHGQRVRGHTLCWHRALPDWLKNVPRDDAEATLIAHIRSVMGHYRGQMVSWDVVNEAIEPGDGQPGDLRNGFWYRMLGARYVEIAYRAAHDADPQAILCYNDYGLETDSPSSERKRGAVLAMLRDLRHRGVPIHAVGLQSHLRAGDANRLGAGLSRFIQAIRDLDMAVYVTELDVDDSQIDAHADGDAAVAATYKRYLDLVLDTKAASAVLTWGVWDPENPRRIGATPEGALARAPLAFGRQGALKPASWAVAHCLERAPHYPGLPRLTAR
ncbi:MAG: Exoglucanase/xylanase [Luteibacter sp.]|uniref:endo-1,4-beta-xylanase n=1 Tax=Luteibacter sp. TaxID=1886636 RepID=UPI00138523AA|nr:endo-1,4-beta-xylanase [Luteibacter sp.]KAF1007264.1 MAG: Exoglucanase/xylanase [Luteibacter sp.]